MRSRPLIILITVCILFSSVFVISCSASGTENLIDSDLNNWEVINPDFPVEIYSNSNIYRLSAKATSNYFLGIIYDLPNFTAGHSYSLSFKLPSASDIVSAWNVSFTDDLLKGYYNNSTLFIGYGFLSADGTSVDTQIILYEFNSSNISKYVGKTLRTSFVAGSSSGRPVVYIGVSTNDSATHFFYLSDFVLIDNDDNSEQLSGIKGLLHSLRWDIFGGVCDDNDCSHSSDLNPHVSLTQRLTSALENYYNTIASKFETGSTLNTWFTNLGSVVNNLGSSIDGFLSSLGDRFDSFITNLGNRLSDEIDLLGFDIGGWFDDTVSSIDSFFDGLWSKFDEFFNKFKPRVYERFKWHRGIINWNTGEVTLKDDNYPYVIVSDFLTVSPGSIYMLNYQHTSELGGLSVFQYDYYGNYIVVLSTYTSSVSDVVLPSGFLYRFRCQFPIGDTHLNNINSYVRVYCDEGWINSIIHQIEDFGTGCINLVLYFDWYGYYDNPFVNTFPVLDFLFNLFESVSDFLITANDSFNELVNSTAGAYSLFDLVVDNVPYLFLFSIVSLVLIVISRIVGI